MKEAISSSNDDQRESKITISSLRILFPNLDKTYYLNIIINNETKPFKTKQIEFKGNNNQCTINQSFLIDPSIKAIDSISFQLFEKTSIFSSPLYKGEVKFFRQQCDDFSPNLVCYLKKSTNEDFAVIYYTVDFKGEDVYQKLFKAKPIQGSSKTVSIMDLTTGDKNDAYSLFIHNLDYARNAIELIEEVLHWKNYWKTLGLLFVLSFGIVSLRLLIVFIIPLGLIFVHLMYKDRMKESFLLKSKQFDKEKNIKLFHQIIAIINSFIMLYDSFAIRLTSEDNALFITGLYLNLLKVSIWGVLFCFTPLSRLLLFKAFSLISLWLCFLSFNPTYYAFYLFIQGLMREKLHSIGYYSSKATEMRQKAKAALISVIPFMDMLLDKRVNDEIRDSSLFASKASSSEAPMMSLKKYELYENERWWMFLGWAKNLFLNEAALWCTSEDTQTYCDMKMVFLHNSNDYKWSGDWKVKKTEMTDENGWEYAANSFNDKFDAKSEGKYVRRRKWVRFASMKDVPAPAKEI